MGLDGTWCFMTFVR